MGIKSTISSVASSGKSSVSNNKKEALAVVAGVGFTLVIYKSRKFFGRKAKKAFKQIPSIK